MVLLLAVYRKGEYLAEQNPESESALYPEQNPESKTEQNPESKTE